MASRKRNSPGAGATARRAEIVASGKSTSFDTPKPPFDASAYARTWIARRYRAQSRWAGLIAEAAGLGGRP